MNKNGTFSATLTWLQMLSSRSAPAWIDEDQGHFVTAEFSRICQDPVDGIYAVPLYMDNLIWKGSIMIRAGVYSGGTFRFTLQLPSGFPYSPEIPKAIFDADIYHPYITSTTRQLCLQSCFPHGQWNRETNRIIDIFHYLQEAFAVLSDKFPLDPLSIVNLGAASLFENDFDNFQLRAEEIVAISRATIYDLPTDCLDPYLIIFTPWEEAKMDPIRRKLLGLPSKTPESSSTPTSRTFSDFSSRGTAGDADDERPGSTGSGLDDVSLRNLTALNFDDELEASSKPTPTHEFSDLSSVDLESAPLSARNSLVVLGNGMSAPPEPESKDDVRADYEEECQPTTDFPDVPSKQTVVDVEEGYDKPENDEDVDSEPFYCKPNKPVAFRIGGDDSSTAELTDNPDSTLSSYSFNPNFSTNNISQPTTSGGTSKVIIAVKILLPRRLPSGIVATCNQLRAGCSTSSCDGVEPETGGSIFTVSRRRSRSIHVNPEMKSSRLLPSRRSDQPVLIDDLDQYQISRPSRARRKNQKSDSFMFQQLNTLQNGRLLRLFKLLAILVIIMVSNMPTGTASGIGCFMCSSFNGSNSECEDTFNSSVAESATGNIANYQFPCWAFKKNRHGLFPADHCIKISGHRKDFPDHTIVIRTCAMDSGTLTADTEIVRISHCGFFKYEGHQFSGCVQACDTDGCNSAHLLVAARLQPLWVISVGIAMLTASSP